MFLSQAENPSCIGHNFLEFLVHSALYFVLVFAFEHFSSERPSLVLWTKRTSGVLNFKPGTLYLFSYYSFVSLSYMFSHLLVL